jgi:hypothetical protein
MSAWALGTNEGTVAPSLVPSAQTLIIMQFIGV